MGTWKRSVLLATLAAVLAGMLYEGGTNQAAAEGLFDDVNLGLVSIGGRATYFDPKDGDANWFAAANSVFIRSNFSPLKAPSTIARQILIRPPSGHFQSKDPR